MKKINIGILGLGEHCCQSHLEHIRNNQNIDKIYVFDKDDSKKDNYAFQELEFLNSEEELINSNVDAVFIMTPDAFHAKSTFEVINAGKHVFCEKPMATNLIDIEFFEKALDVANDKNLIVSSCHPRRFDPPFIWLKDNLLEFQSDFGKVIDFRFMFSYHKPSKINLHSGLLIDHFSHEIDLLTFLFGYSKFQALKLNDSQIKYGVAGQREDGISFSFLGSRMLENRIYPEFCFIIFEKGHLELNTYNGTYRSIHHDALMSCSVTSKAEKTNYSLRFKETNDNFINAIMHKADNYLSLNDLKVNTRSGIVLSILDHYK